MTFQFVTAAFLSCPTHNSTARFHAKAANSSGFSTLLYEKTEEEKESEAEKDTVFSFELVDFSRIVIGLSYAHTPHHLVLQPDRQFNLLPSFTERLCTYRI
jgi:hypothetical protein